MYNLLKRGSHRELLLQQLPGLTGSLLVAEMFFKFGSFSLEALAFLAVWFVFDVIVQSVRNVFEQRQATEVRS